MLTDDAHRCANITVRREIDSLNERLTGDGQTVEGGDPSKGVLKTKGTVFSPQAAFVELTNAALCWIEGKGLKCSYKSPNVSRKSQFINYLQHF